MSQPGAPVEAPLRRGLSGHLKLCCAAGPDGRSYLREQSFCAPIHLSKPHLDEGVLVVNVVNPTAGLLAGDQIHVQARVEAGARLLLTAPSASRAHCMPEGSAFLDQQFEVATGGSLESWPEIFIPQRGTSYRQHTTARVEPGGELFLYESLAPGRVASGEAFAYRQLEWVTDIFLGDTPIARERYRLNPSDNSLKPLRERFATGYYASCLVVTPHLNSHSPCWAAIENLQASDVWVAYSAMAKGGWTIKVVAAGSIALRRTLSCIRGEIAAALGRTQPALRRAGEK